MKCIFAPPATCTLASIVRANDAALVKLTIGRTKQQTAIHNNSRSVTTYIGRGVQLHRQCLHDRAVRGVQGRWGERV